MEAKIFYSWQTDCPKEINKELISDAITEALGSAPKFDVEPALRVDSGLDGVSGSPEVAKVMFEKISSSAIFIGDVTLVGETKTKIKKLANPNVLMEMGYAASALGWERVICIMNECYGKRQEQPFDIRNRRFPIDYTLSPDSTSEKIAKGKDSLINIIKVAVEGVLNYQNEMVYKAIKRLDLNCLNIMMNFGKSDQFIEPDPSSWGASRNLDCIRFRNGIIRLLDLGVIITNAEKGVYTYSYNWTYLGIEVLKELGHR